MTDASYRTVTDRTATPSRPGALLRAIIIIRTLP